MDTYFSQTYFVKVSAFQFCVNQGKSLGRYFQSMKTPFCKAHEAEIALIAALQLPNGS